MSQIKTSRVTFKDSFPRIQPSAYRNSKGWSIKSKGLRGGGRGQLEDSQDASLELNGEAAAGGSPGNLPEPHVTHSGPPLLGENIPATMGFLPCSLSRLDRVSVTSNPNKEKG